MTADKSAVEALADECAGRHGSWRLSTFADALREAIAADRAAGERLQIEVNMELVNRAEKAERERDEWKARAEMWEAGAVRYKESRDAADEARRLAYARGRDEALAEVVEALWGDYHRHSEANANDCGLRRAVSIIRDLREGSGRG